MRIAHPTHRTVFFYLMFAILAVLSLWCIFPFLKSIIAGVILAFICYPLYNKLVKKIHNKNVVAIMITILVLIIIIVPIGFVANHLIKEATFAYVTIKQNIEGTDLECKPDKDNLICDIGDKLDEVLENQNIKDQLTKGVENTMQLIADKSADIIISFPKMVLNIFIMFVVFFFLLKDGKFFLNKIESILPIKKESREELFNQIRNVTKGIIHGYLVTALVQGAAALIGFYVINWIFSTPTETLINAPLLWTLVLAIVSMIPILGSGFVWGPLAAILFAQGYFGENPAFIAGGIVLFLYGLIVISNVDNIARPLFAGKKAKVHPLVIFLGIFGGLISFGIIGIIAGPLLLAIMIVYLRFYEEGKA